MISIFSKMFEMFKSGRIIILFFCTVITLETYAQSAYQNDSKDKAPRSIMLATPQKCFIKTMQDYKRHKVLGLKKGQASQLEAIQGTRKVPVLLGKFPDTPNDPWNPNDLKKELFDGPWPIGTMKQYFQDMSYGQFNIDGLVSNWFTVSHPKSYYGTNGRSFDNPHTGEFMKEMLDLADSSIDFRQFDNDGPDGIPNSGDDDGYVDVVFFISVGSSGGSLDDIYPHFSLLGAPYGTKDTGINGKPIMIDEYTIQNSSEVGASDPSKVPSIGVFCHEFGHALGLPDLYDVDLSSSGIGGWGLMSYYSYGSNDHPVGMEAWSKYHLGWIIPPVFDEGDHLNLTIRNSYQNSEAYIVKKKGSEDYYLFENRRKIRFDQSIANEGLLIWHVDESEFKFGQVGGIGWDNNGNADDKHRGVDLERADNNELSYLEAGDTYPGTSNNHTFDRNSVPNSRDWNGFDTGVEISNITQQGDNIIADIKVHATYLNSIITEPQSMVFFNTKNPIKIKGTADGTNITGYDLDIGGGIDPQSWINIGSYSSRVIDSTLGYFDPSNISKEDIYTLRLTSKDNEGTSVKTSPIYINPLFLAGWPQTVEDRIVAQTIGADDVDHDGNVEIIAGVSNDSKFQVKLYILNANGTSKNSSVWPKELNGSRISGCALADIDKNGKKEIIINTTSYLYVLRIDGSNVPGWPKPFGTYSAPVVSDIDGDGNLEIIASNSFSNTVLVWNSNGTTKPGWPQNVEGAAFYTPVVADLDNDGKCEIIEKSGYGKIYVWSYQGQLLTGWPAANQLDYQDYDGSSPVVGDLDGDGYKEIVSFIGNSIYVFKLNGTVAAGWPRIPLGWLHQSVALADLNADNQIEVITTMSNVSVFDPHGNLLPGWPTQYLSTYGGSELLPPIVADINGDGRMEIIVVDDKMGNDNNEIVAFSDEGQVLEGWPKKLPGLVNLGTYWKMRRCYTPLITDINKDGNIELAIGAEDKVLFWDLGCKLKCEHTSWLKWQSNKWNTGEYQFIPSDDVPFATISCLRSLSFGNVKIGQSKDTIITITNAGNDTLKITSIASMHSSFSVHPTILTIVPQQSFNDTIRFTPGVVGNINSKILIMSNAPSSRDTITVTGIGEDPNGIASDLSNQIPKEYSIAQNFPNPFNATTIIRYGVPQKSLVRIDIFDVLGKLVATIVDGEHEAGYYDANWNKEVASGFYFYRFAATALNDPSKKIIEVRRMVLLK
jgi:M6 family metalloprotease-like protein